MKVFARICQIILMVITILLLLFTAGTVIPALPVFGSVGNIATVGFLHLFLPAGLVLVVLWLVLTLVKRKKTFFLAGLILSGLALSFTLMTYVSISSAVRKAGVEPQLFRRLEDVSQVKVRTFVYTSSDSGPVKLNVYSLDNGAADRPVMLYIHGGGWIQGSKEDHTYYSKVFANHGYVVVSADYDLSGSDRHLAASTELQLLEAFAWIGKYIGEYGGDPERLYLTGGSAGGNLALELAYKINSGIYSSAADGTPLPEVRAVSVNFPVASVKTFYENTDLILGSTARKMAGSYTGCSPETDPELYQSLEPASHISAKAPPTLILVGDNDTLVPPEATLALRDALAEAGIDQLTVSVPYANHIFDMVDGNMLNSAYLDLSLRWFEEHR